MPYDTPGKPWINFSMTPTSRPPATQPTGDSRPPMIAPTKPLIAIAVPPAPPTSVIGPMIVPPYAASAIARPTLTARAFVTSMPTSLAPVGLLAAARIALP